MMIVRLERNIERNQKQKNSQEALQREVSGEVAIDRCGDFSPFKSSQSKASQSRSLAGITSGRITRAKRHTVIDTYATDLRGMDRARVIPTWCWGSKSVDRVGGFSMPGKRERLTHTNGHGVSNIDRNDFTPWNSHLIERIDDGHTLIEDDHFGSDEDRVGKARNQARPEQCGHATGDREVSETLVGIDRRRYEGDRCEDRATSWSEGHRISHAVIISRRDAR
jgi:hypothetical protein